MRTFVNACNLLGYFCGMKRLIAIVITAAFMYMLMTVRYEMLRQRYEEQIVDLNNTNLYSFKNKLKLRQSGDYWILHNYILPEKQFVGNESVTLNTHGTHKSLKGLHSLVKRWSGPVTITIFATDDDFLQILYDIQFLRGCTYMKRLINSLVTFNFVFHAKYLPKKIPISNVYAYKGLINCLVSPGYLNDTLINMTHPLSKPIRYPLNLMRNVGRYSIYTYYQLSLDMNMYTSPYFAQHFLRFVSSIKLSRPYESVFCVPSFNNRMNYCMPNSAHELKRQLVKNYSNIFNIRPDVWEDEFHFLGSWLNVTSPRLQSFLLTGYHSKWQPYYVSINDMEPLADERFMYNTLFDRSMQIDLINYLNYEFVIMSGGYFIHRGEIIEESKLKTKHSINVRAKINAIYRRQNYVLYKDGK
ncbi:beta-1,4-glucuronyltransferase 1-like [Teleopsis dalmanni]|uniref:beta-1,4-glucuronyltransferase 1-like n=1 Tax=Teleopsis dalmanni TaxID=139649 RepID=UPI0018CE5AD5|nr:beta-1,4-glucuronyltransferase 1-like [Teleopsis dalmanni]XP_037927927.1 beta-1,4-glucuronyltransferase 1-like [Teleopsis dalmanni]